MYLADTLVYMVHLSPGANELATPCIHQIQPEIWDTEIVEHNGRRARSRSLHFYPTAKLKLIEINWNWNQTQLHTQSSSKSEHLIHFIPCPLFFFSCCISFLLPFLQSSQWQNCDPILFVYFHLQNLHFCPDFKVTFGALFFGGWFHSIHEVSLELYFWLGPVSTQ